MYTSAAGRAAVRFSIRESFDRHSTVVVLCCVLWDASVGPIVNDSPPYLCDRHFCICPHSLIIIRLLSSLLLSCALGAALRGVSVLQLQWFAVHCSGESRVESESCRVESCRVESFQGAARRGFGKGVATATDRTAIQILILYYAMNDILPTCNLHVLSI